MEERELTCIICPKGCSLKVSIQEGKVSSVEGNSCKRGREYGEKECTNPTRTVTSTIPVKNGRISRVPVKTAGEIPKESIFACMDAIRGLSVEAPVKIGEVVMKNVAGTGVDLVAAREIERIVPKEEVSA
jgi:CxxC motif-containing protein